MSRLWVQDLAKGAGAQLDAPKEAGEAAVEVNPEVAQRMATLPAKLKELQGAQVLIFAIVTRLTVRSTLSVTPQMRTAGYKSWC